MRSDFYNTSLAYRELTTRDDRRGTFLDIRQRFPDIAPAEFLFLMKNCHGTRFRVNRAGRFNGPYKADSKPTASARGVATDTSRMHAVTVYLRHADVRFQTLDAHAALEQVAAGDFVFLDPPYQWQDAGEADYGVRFGARGWAGLMDAVAALPAGVHVMITLHGSMPETTVRSLAARVPGLIHLEPLWFAGSHMARGGLHPRCEWLLTNYTTTGSQPPGPAGAACGEGASPGGGTSE